MIAATQFEYRFRFLIHGVIYALGFFAFWERDWWRIGQHTLWLELAGALSRAGLGFASATNAVLIAAILFAAAGAALRLWASAYLGASTVFHGNMLADRVTADGPYRFVRNPLYIGVVFTTVALCTLMRPAGAALTLVLILAFELRLIAREEPFLRKTLGPTYTAYAQQVPRLVPRLRTHLKPAGARANWSMALLGELFFVGTAISFAALGWKYDGTLVLRGILISLGLSLISRSFLPRMRTRDA